MVDRDTETVAILGYQLDESQVLDIWPSYRLQFSHLLGRFGLALLHGARLGRDEDGSAASRNQTNGDRWLLYDERPYKRLERSIHSLRLPINFRILLVIFFDEVSQAENVAA